MAPGLKRLALQFKQHAATCKLLDVIDDRLPLVFERGQGRRQQRLPWKPGAQRPEAPEARRPRAGGGHVRDGWWRGPADAVPGPGQRQQEDHCSQKGAQIRGATLKGFRIRSSKFCFIMAWWILDILFALATLTAPIPCKPAPDTDPFFRLGRERRFRCQSLGVSQSFNAIGRDSFCCSLILRRSALSCWQALRKPVFG